MPAMSPRRSSRARTTQPIADAGPVQSSTSSMSSSRTERNTRSQNKTTSPHKSNTPRSRSSEDDDALARPSHIESSNSRQRKRKHSEEPEALADKAVGIEEELEDGEEEITRCICGSQDYPGPPVPVAEQKRASDLKSGHNSDPDDSLATTEVLPEEAGALFIQCDTCKVWQHGGCVGIMDDSLSPEEYYCEECRSDLHKISIGTNGQKYSRYLPVTGDSPKSSRASSQSQDADPKMRDKSGRLAAPSLSAKRRSTMNSRDAAYDEEELVRRAIEESRTLDSGGSVNSEILNRRPKRGRSDSEETSSKRQRTSSDSPSPENTRHHSQAIDTDDEAATTRFNGSLKRNRGAVAARTQRERDLRDKERERERQDAAGRRKGRAERRRGGNGAVNGDDSDPSDDIPLSQTANKRAQPAIEASPARPAQTPSTTVPDATPPPPSSTHSRKPAASRATHSRRSRVGRNQYTKDRDRSISPSRSASRDLAGVGGANHHLFDGNNANGLLTNGHVLTNGDTTKPSRPRYMHPQRTSMNEMRRRVAAILEFISKVQLEMVESGSGNGETAGGGGGGGGKENNSAVGEMLKATMDSLPGVNGVNGGNMSVVDPEAFRRMTTVDMMAVITRQLTAWQEEYGRYGDKS